MSAKILVIDDNPTNLKLASELLEFEGVAQAAGDVGFVLDDEDATAKRDLAVAGAPVTHRLAHLDPRP